jgi:glutamyl-tRNA synthetase
VVNFLCLLGWNPKTTQEVMNVAEVVAIFDAANINHKAAVFDLAKCEWMNQQYILRLTPEQLAEKCAPFLARAGINASADALPPVAALFRERLKRLTEAPASMDYFFTDRVTIDAEAREKALNKPGALERLRTLRDSYAACEWNAAALENALKSAATAAGVKAGEFVHPARVAATGRTVGASLYHTLEVLGRDRVLDRFDQQLAEPIA